MPNKNFSIYSSDEEHTIHINSHIVIEIGKWHIACISKEENKKTVSAFELFTFNEEEAANFPKLFTAVTAGSKILSKTFSAADIFINNDYSIPVPLFKFTQEIAGDYLKVIFGEDPLCKVLFEHLPIEPGMIIVYRAATELLNFLNHNLAKVTFRHTYSNIIRTIISNVSAFPSEFIYIQFYSTYIIAVVMKDKKLQLIQSFIYEAPEDVVYYLLNITNRFEFNTNELTLLISGMIDLNFTLYRELITYFKKVEVRNISTSELPPGIKEYPLHYFTPFFNLAL